LSCIVKNHAFLGALYDRTEKRGAKARKEMETTNPSTVEIGTNYGAYSLIQMLSVYYGPNIRKSYRGIYVR
jgi:hypothetical protein